jgi:lipopolysaccharide export system protein LptC
MTAAYADPHRHHIDVRPRRGLTVAQARRRSVLVQAWRWFCVAMAALMVLSIIGSAIWRSSLPSFMGDGLPEVSSPRMINPRFTGRGENGYVITAESALRRSGNSQLVDLDKPSYVSKTGLRVTAPSGIYDPQKQTIDLAGGVTFSDASGNKFETPVAHIDANNSVATGAQMLSGAGRFGDVKSNGFEISANGNTLRMTGGVSGTIKGSAN